MRSNLAVYRRTSSAGATTAGSSTVLIHKKQGHVPDKDPNVMRRPSRVAPLAVRADIWTGTVVSAVDRQEWQGVHAISRLHHQLH